MFSGQIETPGLVWISDIQCFKLLMDWMDGSYFEGLIVTLAPSGLDGLDGWIDPTSKV